MYRIIEEIANVGKEDISHLLDAVLRRYMELYPEWQVNVMSICKRTDLNEQIDDMITLLERMKTSS